MAEPVNQSSAAAAPAAKKPNWDVIAFLKNSKAQNEKMLKVLRLQRDELFKEPSVFELALLSAILAHGQPQGQDNEALRRAHYLWSRSKHNIRREINEMITSLKKLPTDFPEPQAWEIAIFNGPFPMKLEAGLKLLVGTKVRRDGRYKMFREFLAKQYCHPAASVNEQERIERAEKKYADFKAQGISEAEYEKIAPAFYHWQQQKRASQSKEKARAAAAKRWKKKEA